MHIRFSQAMMISIEKHIHDARSKRWILDVYKLAESIRLEHISDNVAREDIIEKIVLLAGSANVPLEFNRQAFESGTYFSDSRFPNGVTVGSLIAEGESVH